MKKFTKYYLLKRNDYLSKDKHPSFFVQLNYGKPTVSNNLKVEANEYLSRNREVQNDKIQNGQTAGANQPISNSFAPFINSQTPARQETNFTPPYAGRPRPQGIPSQKNQNETESSLNNSSFYHDDGGNDDGGFPPDNDLPPSPETVKRFENAVNILNATNNRLDRIDERNSKSAMELTPFEQLNNLEKTLSTNVPEEISKPNRSDTTLLPVNRKSLPQENVVPEVSSMTTLPHFDASKTDSYSCLLYTSPSPRDS